MKIEKERQIVSDKKNSVVFATATFYPKPEGVRFNLACQTIENAVKSGNRIVVVEGSKDRAIQTEFERLGAIVFRENFVPKVHFGLGTAKRDSFLDGLVVCEQEGHAGVFGTEAEKDMSPFVQTMLEALGDDGEVGVPERTSESWLSYPEYQRVSEQAGNAVFEEVTGRKVDVFLGPVLFRPSAAECFIVRNPAKYGYPNTYSQHLGIQVALHEGRRVRSVPVEFRYPAKQREEEEGAQNPEMLKKRQDQFDTLTKAYRTAADVLVSGM